MTTTLFRCVALAAGLLLTAAAAHAQSPAEDARVASALQLMEVWLR
jgi:hypothetical protein